MMHLLLIVFVFSFNLNRIETAGAGLAAVSIFSSNYMRSKSDDNNLFGNNFNNKNAFKTYQRDSYYPSSDSKTNDFPFFSFKSIRETSRDFAQLNSINEDKRIKGNASLIKNSNCPEVCLCQGLSIDCNNRELTEVPRNLPKYLIKMYIESHCNLFLSFLKNFYFVFKRFARKQDKSH